MVNQRYEFVPPDGDPADPIVISGLQEYAPGQQRKVDVWTIEVPQALRGALADGWECRSYAEVTRMLAHAFFNGDESLVSMRDGKA